ncbi:hypothetical protein CRG98_034155 [Punica granatum]|uniref:Uncharacterized protein n=1 Tax=Punica granatum TaxID=22663 RepID=A0A2I0IP14_PUNGR|nr:hypothetical protein CRG98_034155 [Punica granatum]
MNNRRRAGSIRKVEESSRRNLQAKNPENSEVGTAALFITESPKHRKAPRDHQGHGTSLRRSFGTLRGSPKDVSVVRTPSTNLRGTSTENRDRNDPRAPQDIRRTLRKPRPQVPRHSRANGLRSGTMSRRSPTRREGPPKRMLRCTKSNRGPRGIKLHSERPNRAKPTLEAPGRPNVRSHDAWRY